MTPDDIEKFARRTFVRAVRMLLPRPAIVRAAQADGFCRATLGGEGQWVWNLSSSCPYKAAALEGINQLLQREEAVHKAIGDLAGIGYLVLCIGALYLIFA